MLERLPFVMDFSLKISFH